MEQSKIKKPDEIKLSSKLENSKEEFDEELSKNIDRKEENVQEEKQEAKKAELENALLELAELKTKYQEKENECLSAKQKEELISILADMGLEKDVLDIVYTPLDMEKTKEKIEILKSYIEKTKKEIFQNYVNSPLPKASKNKEYDAFLEGFDSNKL